MESNCKTEKPKSFSNTVKYKKLYIYSLYHECIFTVESDEEEEICQSSQESTENDLPEESLVFQEKVEDLDLDDGDADDDSTDDLATKFIKFIQNDSSLYKQILLYEPIWLEDIFQRFKEQIGTTRVKLNQIMDILDNEW